MSEEVEPTTYPGLLHFRCGHGIAVSGDTVGPSIWMVVTDTERTQLGVSMRREDAVTVSSALIDSVMRSCRPEELGTVKAVGGTVENTLRQILDRLEVLRSMLTPEQLATDEGPSMGVDLMSGQIRWLLGERV